MKKILLLTLTIISGLYGCKKGYDEAISTNTLIVGKWGHVKDSIITFAHDSSTVQIAPGGVDSILFNKGTSGNDGLTDFKYDLRGYFLTLKYPAYNVNGVTIPATNYDLTVKALTKTNLVLFYNFKGVDSVGKANGSVVYRTYSK